VAAESRGRGRRRSGAPTAADLFDATAVLVRSPEVPKRVTAANPNADDASVQRELRPERADFEKIGD